MSTSTSHLIDLSGGPAGLIQLRNAAGERAAISLYGAQLLSWQDAAGCELLYCSPQPLAKPGAPIRGGVPVCFPQFAGRGALPKHGFVRTAMWQLDDSHGALASGADQDVACARLSLSDSDATRALWPYSFLLQLQVELGAGWISVALNVSNTGADAFDFTAALHTYLACADVRQAGVASLQDVSFIDSTRNADGSDTTTTQAEALLRIDGETDRIYLASPAALTLEQDGKPALQLEQQGFSDSVVWNPGPDKAAQLGDMPADDWTRMLCIEAAQVAHPIRLSPQATWRGVQRLART